LTGKRRAEREGEEGTVLRGNYDAKRKRGKIPLSSGRKKLRKIPRTISGNASQDEREN